MHYRTNFPRSIRDIENTWIPLADGTRLAARIWLPTDAHDDPVPAILEYIPYRKDDGTAIRDSLMHPYFAGHGYAAIRVDMRGSGDSDGILYDEYLPQEQDDALEVLTWIAHQPWCTGQVGIIGKSWGGFNGLQIAARRPPELKAIISVCSTDDRYADDVHYMGGCLLASEMLGWASIMFGYNALPPDPRFAGDHWREMWFERMAESPPFVEAWLKHQRRDEFWQHGSVCEDFSAITCPVYAIGGWADAYSNAIPRLLAGLDVPRKGLIGPWVHEYPQRAVPGPAIGFLQECLRWWDHWLKDIDSGIMAEPMLRVWMQTSLLPQTYYAERPGRWVAEPAWPSPNIEKKIHWLSRSRLINSPGFERVHTLRGAQANGLTAGVWCAYGRPGDLAADQRPDDGLSLAFTSDPLEEPQEILGFPEVTLTLAVDRPLAIVAVRLCDVAPTGESTLVSWGLLNLTHRDSHEAPTPLEPGRRYKVKVVLNAIAHAMPAGHRWRIAVSPTYWPHAWPSPEPVTLTLFAGEGSFLALPTRRPDGLDETLTPFGPPEAARPTPHETTRPPERQREVRHDLVSGRHQLINRIDSGGVRFTDHGLEEESITTDTYTIVEGDPLSAKVRCDRQITLRRDDWQVRIETSSVMTADSEAFYVTNSLTAYEGETEVFTRSWDFSVARDLV